MGHSRKHPYHPHGGNRKLTPLPPLDVLIHLLLSETIFSPLPLRMAEISSVGGVSWIFSGTTQWYCRPVEWHLSTKGPVTLRNDYDTITCKHAIIGEKTKMIKLSFENNDFKIVHSRTITINFLPISAHIQVIVV
jgi:hypothetical protein